MLDTSQQTPILFLDFDGTISERDAIDAILEEFADPRWLAIEEEWRTGRIGSRECLRAQMALVRATGAEVNVLLDSIKVDRGFATLLELCARHSVPTHIVSDGFDYCIRRILAGAGPRVARALADVRIFSSHLVPTGGQWQGGFPHFSQLWPQGGGACKPHGMPPLDRAGAPTI